MDNNTQYGEKLMEYSNKSMAILPLFFFVFLGAGILLMLLTVTRGRWGEALLMLLWLGFAVQGLLTMAISVTVYEQGVSLLRLLAGSRFLRWEEIDRITFNGSGYSIRLLPHRMDMWVFVGRSAAGPGSAAARLIDLMAEKSGMHRTGPDRWGIYDLSAQN